MTTTRLRECSVRPYCGSSRPDGATSWASSRSTGASRPVPVVLSVALALLAAANVTAQGTIRAPARVEACRAVNRGGGQCLTRLVPRHLFEPYAAKLSPDGRSFVYSALEGRNLQLRLYDLDTGRTETLTPHPGKRYEPVWSPDGSRIAFWGEMSGAFGELDTGIGVLDLRTGEERLVFVGRFALVSSPVWTPDGRVVFERDLLTLSTGLDPPGTRPQTAVPRFWIMDADGTNAEPFPLDITGTPVFSPVGDLVAWVGRGCEEAGPDSGGIWVARMDGAETRCMLTASGEGPPAWGPDGRTLYYAGRTGDDDRERIYSVGVWDGEIRSLDIPAGRVTWLGVARNGDIGLSLFRPDVRIATVPAAGGTPTAVALPDSIHAFWPVWHPDGSRLGFTASSFDAPWVWTDATFATVKVDSTGAAVQPPSIGPRRGLRPVTGVWSPAGHLFASYDYDDRSFELRLHPAGRPDSLLVGLGGTDWSLVPGPPSWSPEGGRLVVTPGSRRGLMTIAIDSATLAGTRHPTAVELAGFGGTAQLPSHSPDGTRIAFARRIEASEPSGIYVVPSDGGQVETIAEYASGEIHSSPEWSPDGRFMYFAAPDAEGRYGIFKTGPGGEVLGRVTEGNRHALHPRVSPDGRTLALTLWDAATELWVLPSATPVADVPPLRNSAPGLHPPEVPVAHVDPSLLEVVVAAEAPGAALAGLWPGFWDGSQTYALRTAAEPFEALIVTPGPTPPGFRPVAAGGLPSVLHDRLYHANGLAAEVHDFMFPMRIPVLEIPRDLPAVPERLERMLFRLYRELVIRDAEALALVEHRDDRRACGHGCPNLDPESCATWIRLEHRLLYHLVRPPRAVDTPDDDLTARVRSFAAVHRLRQFRERQEMHGERRFGVASFVARRASWLAVGRDTSRIPEFLGVELHRLAPPAETSEPMEREAIVGEAIAWLLDRSVVEWRESVRGGASLAEALLTATDLSEDEVPRIAVEALPERGTWYSPEGIRGPIVRLVPDLPLRGDGINDGFYLDALCRLTPPVRAIRIDLAAGDLVGGGQFELRWSAGVAGSASPREGLILLPDPEAVRLTVRGLELRVEGEPVAIIYDAKGPPSALRLIVYPRTEFGEHIQDQTVAGEGRIQRVLAGGIDLRITPDTQVSRNEAWIQIHSVRRGR